MKLADYLDQAEIKPSAFAERIGVSRQTLWRYTSGERRPEWDVLERIRDETGGQVTPNDFLDEPVEPTEQNEMGSPEPRSAAPSTDAAA